MGSWLGMELWFYCPCMACSLYLMSYDPTIVLFLWLNLCVPLVQNSKALEGMHLQGR